MLHDHDTNPTWVCDCDSQQLVDDIADDLNRVVAGLVAYWVAYEEPTAGQRRCTPHFGMVLIQVWKRTVVDELVQNMA